MNSLYTRLSPGGDLWVSSKFGDFGGGKDEEGSIDWKVQKNAKRFKQ